MVRRRQRERREKQLLACEHCRRSFEGRANAKHCSERCRKAAFRMREREIAKERDRRVGNLLREALEILTGKAENTP